MEPLKSSSSAPSASWKSRVADVKSKAVLNARGVAGKVNTQLRAKPALFAGIAAGLGLALGLTGRIARHRRAMKRIPTLLVIEGAC